MKTYIAILRGINVSGKNVIKMKDLVEVLKKLNFSAIQTYIQSGNVIFSHEDKPLHFFENEIHTAIHNHFGYDVPVLVLTKEYLSRVIADNPFLKMDETDVSKLHVTFLAKVPENELINKTTVFEYPPDEILPGNKSFYVYCPAGYGRTKFNNTFFEKNLKVRATTRNWKSCNKLLELSNG